MAVWDKLKVVLARLRDEQRGALMLYPMPKVDEGRQPPFVIRLAPWAAANAAELHQQFGDDVQLTVGALPYPPGRQPPRPPAAGPAPDLLDLHEIAAELDGPAVVGSGHNLLHGLLLRNLTDRELQLATNGQVTAVVVDPHTGEVVGGFAGLENRPLIMFKVAPAQTGRIPLLIGTASCTPRLGYAIPPGDWGLYATLTLGSPSATRSAGGPGPAPHHHRLNHRRARAAPRGNHRKLKPKAGHHPARAFTFTVRTPAQRTVPSHPSTGQDIQLKPSSRCRRARCHASAEAAISPGRSQATAGFSVGVPRRIWGA